MGAFVRTPMTLAEFLAWEERQEFKYEFDGFSPVAMTGDTTEHNRISLNLTSMLRERLRGTKCQPFGSDMKIEVAGHIRYPDAIVVCRDYPRGPTVSSRYQEYRDTPSIRHYVMLEQDFVGAQVFSRSDAKWAGVPIADHGVISLPDIDIELPMAELYEGVALG